MAEILGDLFLDFETFPFVDRSTNNHTLVNNGLTQATNTSAKGSASLLCDGVEEIDITSTTGLSYLEDQEFTVDFWCKSNDWTGSDKFIEAGGSSNRWFVGLRNDEIQFRRGTGATTSSNILGVDTTHLSTTEWNHVAITRNSDNLVKMYINGIERGSVTNTNNKVVSGTTHIGGGSSYRFDGNMDNVRVAQQVLWTSNFDYTDNDALHYASDSTYVRPDNMTSLYDLSTTKGNLRGKAKEGYIRPTIKQFFTSADYEEIVANYELNFNSPNVVLNGYAGDKRIDTPEAGKIVISYMASNNCYTRVGTVSDGEVTFGNVSNVVTGNYMEHDMLVLNDEQVVYLYRQNGSPFRGRIKVGAISGNSISSYGSEDYWTGYSANDPKLLKLSDTKVLGVCRDSDGVGGPYARVLEVFPISGSISAKPAASALSSNRVEGVTATLLDSDKALIVYRDHLSSSSSWGNLKSVILSISGNNVSWNTPATFYSSDNSGSTLHMSCAKLDTDKAIIAYAHWNNAGESFQGRCRIVNVSGTTITYGNEITFNSNTSTSSIEEIAVIDGKVAIIYVDSGSLYSVMGEIVDDNTIDFSDRVKYDTTDTIHTAFSRQYNSTTMGTFLYNSTIPNSSVVFSEF